MELRETSRPEVFARLAGFHQRTNAALMHVHALPNGAVSKNLLQSLRSVAVQAERAPSVSCQQRAFTQTDSWISCRRGTARLRHVIRLGSAVGMCRPHLSSWSCRRGVRAPNMLAPSCELGAPGARWPAEAAPMARRITSLTCDLMPLGDTRVRAAVSCGGRQVGAEVTQR